MGCGADENDGDCKEGWRKLRLKEALRAESRLWRRLWWISRGCGGRYEDGEDGADGGYCGGCR
jgi:hypothetical protein